MRFNTKCVLAISCSGMKTICIHWWESWPLFEPLDGLLKIGAMCACASDQRPLFVSVAWVCRSKVPTLPTDEKQIWPQAMNRRNTIKAAKIQDPRTSSNQSNCYSSTATFSAASECAPNAVVRARSCALRRMWHHAHLIRAHLQAEHVCQLGFSKRQCRVFQIGG